MRCTLPKLKTSARHGFCGAKPLWIATVLVWAIAAIPAETQTFNVIHYFTNGGDGGVPVVGLTYVARGNFYGATMYGGRIADLCNWIDETPGCGVIFKLSHAGSGWVLNPIYSFYGSNSDGRTPHTRIAIAADKTLYGTTLAGPGIGGWGTVFHLTPSPTTPRAALSPWNERMVYHFAGGSDGRLPQGDLAIRSGRIYGTADGKVYELTSSGGSWTETVLASNGAVDGVAVDGFGDLFGATSGVGAAHCGGIYELVPSNGGWTEQPLYAFTGGADGCNPVGGLIVDASGALYGTTGYGGQNGGGTAFKLTPGVSGWSFNTIYSFSSASVPSARLVMDATGNLFGTTQFGGAYQQGSVFELQASRGQWSYRSLHDFTGGQDGAQPMSSLILDTNGKLYGTTSAGGTGEGGCALSGYPGCGVIFEITP